MIIRIPHRRRFTIIADAALKDDRISFRATGVLAYLLSMPDGSEISGRRLTDAKPEGRDAVFKAMTELEEAGYLRRERWQKPDGTWSTTVVVSETPSPGFQDSVTGNRHSTSHQPSPEKPSPDNPDLKASSTSNEYLGTAALETVRAPEPLDAAARARGADFFKALRKGGTS